MSQLQPKQNEKAPAPPGPAGSKQLILAPAVSLLRGDPGTPKPGGLWVRRLHHVFLQQPPDTVKRN